MPEIILHHYPQSPFSEKVRLALGLKQLAWRSVIVSRVPPRPDLLPLTGGYRRTPVMQLGADIYCDTQLILRALERLHPAPSLYPDATEGVASALAFGWDRATWVSVVGLLVALIGDKFPPEFLEDRSKGYFGYELSKPAMEPRKPLLLARLRAQLAWVEAMLADGRPWLLGVRAGAADLSIYHSLWALRMNCGAQVDALLGFGAPLLAWMERVKGIGHGAPFEMTPAQALEVATQAAPAAPSIDADGDPSGYKPGMRVTVTPDDHARVPVTGTLVAADAQELIIRRSDERAGDIHVHFPRAGFDVEPAQSS